MSVFSPNTEKYGPEKTPHLDIFHAVIPKITCTFSNINRSKTKKKIPDKKHLVK